jgi:tRNA threonylcarbamoyladenosine biosynthesis protein TsaE
MEVFHASTVVDVAVLAKRIVAALEAAHGLAHIALSGDLGAGKTTLVQAIARELGVVDTVTSPTFVVMKQYKIAKGRFDTLVHIDAYRIEDEAELGVLHARDLFDDSSNLVVVEWPEKVPSYTSDSTIHIRGTVAEDGGRDFEIIKGSI